MTPDEVKAALLSVRETKVDFTLVFSGKQSHRVNGLYKPQSREIVLHNRNFKTDNDLFFTALHEYAHHIHVTEEGGPSSARGAHAMKFWAIFHGLLSIAEAAGLYVNPARSGELAEATKKVESLIAESGRIMREIGKSLLEAAILCESQGARFDDYVMRTLKQTMPWARACMAAAGGAIPDDLGAENIKTIAAIKNEDAREAAIAALEGDLSPQQVRAARVGGAEPEDIAERLEKERDRITRTIERLAAKQAEIERRIEEARS